MAQNFSKLANTPENASIFASPCPLMQDLLHGHALPACSLMFSNLQAAVSSPFRFVRETSFTTRPAQHQNVPAVHIVHFPPETLKFWSGHPKERLGITL